MTPGRPVRLGRPDDSPKPLSQFPSVGLNAGVTLWRCHRADRAPWWFASSDPAEPAGGRFDLPAPLGTCYLAEDPLIAVLEALSHAPGGLTGVTVSPAALEERRIRELPLSRRSRFADTTDGRGLAFGVTRELAVVADYERTRQWAVAFRSVPFDGLRYLSTMFQPTRSSARWKGRGAQGPTSVALFGKAGERRRWRRGRAGRVEQNILRRLVDEAGLRVAPVAAANEVTVLPVPSR